MPIKLPTRLCHVFWLSLQILLVKHDLCAQQSYGTNIGSLCFQGEHEPMIGSTCFHTIKSNIKSPEVVSPLKLWETKLVC